MGSPVTEEWKAEELKRVKGMSNQELLDKVLATCGYCDRDHASYKMAQEQLRCRLVDWIRQ